MAPTRQPPAARSSYDPRTGRITLAAGATPMHLAHERAHEAQHQHGTRPWRLHHAIPAWMPYVHRITRLLVELEANQLAQRALCYAGRYDRDARHEYRMTIVHAFLALLWISTPKERAVAEVTSPDNAKRVNDARSRNPLLERPATRQNPSAAPSSHGPDEIRGVT